MFLTSYFIWGMGEFFKVSFFVSEKIMALKESVIRDQFSRELQLVLDLKFMHSLCLIEYLPSYSAQYAIWMSS